MPISANTPLHNLPPMLRAAVATYNAPGSRTVHYNGIYDSFINARQLGIATHGDIHGWILHGGAHVPIYALLRSFGMTARKSRLVALSDLALTLRSLPRHSIRWIEGFALPLKRAPCHLKHPTGGSLATELGALFTTLSAPGSVTVSGGYVAASKTLRFFFELPRVLAHSGNK